MFEMLPWLAVLVSFGFESSDDFLMSAESSVALLRIVLDSDFLLANEERLATRLWREARFTFSSSFFCEAKEALDFFAVVLTAWCNNSALLSAATSFAVLCFPEIF